MASVQIKNIFEERWNRECEIYDPYVDDINDYDFKKGLYFIGTKHPDFTDFKFPYDSIVIDPWRYIPKQDDIKVIWLKNYNLKTKQLINLLN